MTSFVQNPIKSLLSELQVLPEIRLRFYILNSLCQFQGHDLHMGSVGIPQGFCVVLQPFRVRGCILTLVERMDEEFTKIMQNTDPHSQGELNNEANS